MVNGFGFLGVFRPSTGMWYFDIDGSGWSGSCNGSPLLDLCLGPLGGPGDLPVITGDNHIGIYRPSEGRFYLDWNDDGVWSQNGCTPGPTRVLAHGVGRVICRSSIRATTSARFSLLLGCGISTQMGTRFSTAVASIVAQGHLAVLTTNR